MSIFGEIDKNRKTAIYIRISTSMQQTDRQREELLDYAMRNDIVIREEDIYVDIISGFKEGDTTIYSFNLQKFMDIIIRHARKG